MIQHIPLFIADDSNCAGARHNMVFSGSNVVGQYIPTCDAEGNYETTQCNPSTGECWCTKKMTGERIDGTSMSPGQPRYDCDNPNPASKH